MREPTLAVRPADADGTNLRWLATAFSRPLPADLFVSTNEQ
jgi:hypothetical protein